MIGAVALSALISSCAVTVAPSTMAAIVSVESGGNELAIHNNTTGQALVATDAASATALASKAIAAGNSVDLGLGQINSANLSRLSMTVQDAFDPCKNLAGAGSILLAFYGAARAGAANDQAGVRMAISAYNTGNDTDGFSNGYVQKVVSAATQPMPPVVVPAISGSTASAPATTSSPAASPKWDVFEDFKTAGGAAARPATPPAGWDVFGAYPRSSATPPKS